MAIERWNPWRELMTLREAMDRLFEDSFVRPSGTWSLGRTSGQGWFPLDLRETGDNVEVRASLPGVKPEDVQVTVHGDTLTIRAETKDEQERQDQNWIIREHRAGTFQRMVTLPAPVNTDQAQAHLDNGVLTLTLPKAAEGKPRQIKIGTGSRPALQSQQPQEERRRAA